MAGREVSLRALRTARIVLVGMVFLYVWVGETNGPLPRPVNPLLRIAVYSLAASIIPTTIWLRSRELKRAKDSVARQPGDVVALRRWRTIQLVVLACFLAIPLYGLVLRFQGGTLVQALPFYIVGIVLLSFLPLREAERT
jgi:uncharacterized membrane protein